MSNSIKFSPKYGVNPTISVCFWCGKEKNEIALCGRIGDGRKHEDFEAPKHAVLNYEPCDECKKNMALGFTVMAATTVPNAVSSVEMQKNVYPTGQWVVLKHEAAERIFGEQLHTFKHNKAFIDADLFKQMFSQKQ